MGVGSFAVVVWAVFGLLSFGFSIPDIWVDQETPASVGQTQVIYNYDRLDEVKKECKSVLSSASALSRVDGTRLETMLSFENGDWSQVDGDFPIMPFDVRYRDRRDSYNNYAMAGPEMTDPLSLVSFWVKDVSREHQTKDSIALSAIVNMAIVGNGGFADYGYDRDPQFRMWTGQSQLSIPFEGIYTENDRERVLCMLGKAMLPERDSGDASNPWKWVNDSEPFGNNHRPTLLEDDRIRLILRFPKSFTLTNRVIRGEMTSLNQKTNMKYFDNVEMASQLGISADYEFSSEKLVSKACSPYPYKNDSLLFPGINVYKGNSFCEIVEEISRNQFFTVLPNWKCAANDSFCDKLGPFGANKEINATDGGFKGVSLYMQLIKCKPSARGRNENSAKVSASFRAILPSENRYSSMRRSGISNLTLAAEGIWNSTTGQLCMVGCLGSVDSKGNGCDSRICLYLPTSFSIRQRSIIYGTITSIGTDPTSFFPLSVEKLMMQRMELWNYFHYTHPTYNYMKFGKAGAFEERFEEFSVRTMIKKSFLTFPKLENADSFQTSLSVLSEDLSLSSGVVTNSKARDRPFQVPEIRVDILSLGPLFRPYFSNLTSRIEEADSPYRTSNLTSRIEEADSPYRTKAQYSEKQLLLNVSAHLSITGNSKQYANVSSLFLEGLYDQRIGKMYLLGCRDVRASWEVLHESGDLEDGLDCLIEVIVAYPATGAWLADPRAKISIASQRNSDDPLCFSPVKLQTYPITYRKQREDFLSRRGVEGTLRIVTLSMAIGFILSQLFHIKHNADAVPYMSLVMLGIQALGYVLPLVTDAEALFRKSSSETYESSSYALEQSRWFHIVDYAVKLLVMAALLLTLRLCQKVWKSRSRLVSRFPQEPHRVPSDKKVLLSTVAIHVIGYVLVLTLHGIGVGQKPIRTRNYEYSSGNSRSTSEWEAELEEYVGLVQDFFLLPQVIGNLIWQIDSKPLRKLYYFGLTAVRLLPHLYDWVRPSVDNPYFPQEYEFVDPNTDFYSKFGDVAIPLTAIVLAALVYAQQRWDYEKLSRCATLGRVRLLPKASRAYERLPSSSLAFEAELTPSVNGNTLRE